MKILYVHGFGSSYKPESEKVVELSKLGTVIGVNIDYTESHDSIKTLVTECVLAHDIDLIVGTSMGGYFAAVVGAVVGIPFVSCNPAIKPAESLVKYLGTGVDYNGNEFVLNRDAVASHPDMNKNGCGLVLLDSADEVIDVPAVEKYFDGHLNVVKYDGGSHRFEHMKEALPLIENHVNLSAIVYGLN